MKKQNTLVQKNSTPYLPTYILYMYIYIAISYDKAKANV